MNQRSSSHSESLQEQATDLHEEARMILPGVQALFGFQFIAVFNQRFQQLQGLDQHLHLLALLLTMVAMTLLMLPAAYHRIAMRTTISQTFLRRSSASIACALPLIAVSVSIDVYAVSRLINLDAMAAAGVGTLTGIFMLAVWTAWPLLAKAR